MTQARSMVRSMVAIFLVFLTLSGVVGAQVVPPPRLDPFGPGALRSQPRANGPIVRWNRPPLRVVSPLAGLPEMRPLRYQRGDSIGQGGVVREVPTPKPVSTGRVWSQREEYLRLQERSPEGLYRRNVGDTSLRAPQRTDNDVAVQSVPASPVPRIYDPTNCINCGSGRLWTRDAATPEGNSLGRISPPRPDPNVPGNVLIPRANYVRDSAKCTGCGRTSDVTVYPTGQSEARETARREDAVRRVDLRETIRAESPGGCGPGGCSQIITGRSTVRTGHGDYHGLRGICMTCGTTADIVHGPKGYRGEATYPGSSRFTGNGKGADHDAVISARSNADRDLRQRMLDRAHDDGPRH